MLHSPSRSTSHDLSSGAVKAAPHFTEYVRNYIIEHYGEEALYGGLQITTSIDLDLQARAEQIVASGVARMEEYGRNNGAMVVMVPWSGEVLAMVGSADFDNALINGEVNYATCLIQPGSSMKPLVYAAAFEQGLNPGSVLMDIPSQWDVPGEEPYEPLNYNQRFYGAVDVRTALANSLNIPAVKATEYVGVQGVMDTARKMGMVDSLEQDAGYYGLSIGLGAAEVQLLEHTNAYATLANNGTYVPPHPIVEIKDSQGNVLYDLDEEQIAKDSTQAIPCRKRLSGDLDPHRQRVSRDDLHGEQPLRTHPGVARTSHRRQIGHHRRMEGPVDDGLHHRRRDRRLGRGQRWRQQCRLARDRRHPGGGSNLAKHDGGDPLEPGVCRHAQRPGRHPTSRAIHGAGRCLRRRNLRRHRPQAGQG